MFLPNAYWQLSRRNDLARCSILLFHRKFWQRLNATGIQTRKNTNHEREAPVLLEVVAQTEAMVVVIIKSIPILGMLLNLSGRRPTLEIKKVQDNKPPLCEKIGTNHQQQRWLATAAICNGNSSKQRSAISNLQLLLPPPLPYSSSVSASAIVDGKRSNHQQLQQLQSATATATSVNRQLLQSAVIDAMIYQQQRQQHN